MARTPVPPPQRGGIHRTVPSRAVITKAPVGLTATAVFGGGVSARLDKVRDVDGQAHIRGEVSGPALSLTVVLENDSTRPVDLTGVAVSVTGTGGRPENQLSQNGSRPFHGVLAPNATARGVYVFTVPVGDRSHIAVSISYTAAAPVVVFAGRVS